MIASPTYEQAYEALAARLSPKALGHCERVADFAAGLAERFGTDVGTARLAGLLHDWGREDGDERLLASAVRHGLKVDPVDAVVPYLLHAEVSAVELREEFPGLPEEIVDAVASHTYGRIGMTSLDKIVYIADTIEPARSFRGADDLRALALVADLDELFTKTYGHSLAGLIERRRPIHPGTTDVWNWIVTEGRS